MGSPHLWFAIMRKLAIFEEHKCTKEVQLAPPVPRATAVMLACVPAPAPDAGNVCNLSTTGLIQYNNENNLPPNISEANVVLCHINLFWYFLIYLHILDSIYKFLDTFIHFFVFSISYRNDDHHIFLPASPPSAPTPPSGCHIQCSPVAKDRSKTQGIDSGQA